jgi:hypothetical protein
MEIPGQRYLKRILRSLGVETLPPLNEHLTNLERVFRLPPLTPELVKAIRLISPQYEWDSQRHDLQRSRCQDGCSAGFL